MGSVSAVKIVLDPPEGRLGGFKGVKCLFEIELRSVPGDLEDVCGFVSGMLEEVCGEEGDDAFNCVFRGARFRVDAFIYSARLAEEAARLLEEGEPPDEEGYPDIIDVLLAVGVQKAKPDAVYELVGRMAEKMQDIGAAPAVRISVFGGRKALERLQRRLNGVESRLLDDRLALFPTTRQLYDRDLYRRLFGRPFPFNYLPF